MCPLLLTHTKKKTQSKAHGMVFRTRVPGLFILCQAREHGLDYFVLFLILIFLIN